jgi:hypothetical protein
MNMHQKYSKRFLAILTAGIVLMLSVTGMTNLIIDPYGLFNIITISGFNSKKPAIGQHVRMFKAHAVRSYKPASLILGSSRAEYGLDPDHAGWNPAANPTYNLGLPSGSIYEAWRYLLHTHAQYPVKQVVLALDLFMFNENWQTESDFREDRLVTPDNTHPPIGWIRDIITAIFSIDALHSSIETIFPINSNSDTYYQTNGSRDPSNNSENIKKKGGHHKAFLSNETYSLTAPDGWKLFSLGHDGAQGSTPLNTFEQLVKFCRIEGIELFVLISPVHARKLEILWQFGLWNTYEQWKYKLTTILAADAASHPIENPFPLWDFSGYNRITTERVPPLGDIITQMQWYWEGSHYKKVVGDTMLDIIFGNRDTDFYIHHGFGALLTMENIDNHLMLIRNSRANYASHHEKDIKEIAQLISSIGK